MGSLSRFVFLCLTLSSLSPFVFSLHGGYCRAPPSPFVSLHVTAFVGFLGFALFHFVSLYAGGLCWISELRVSLWLKLVARCRFDPVARLPARWLAPPRGVAQSGDPIWQPNLVAQSGGSVALCSVAQTGSSVAASAMAQFGSLASCTRLRPVARLTAVSRASSGPTRWLGWSVDGSILGGSGCGSAACPWLVLAPSRGSVAHDARPFGGSDVMARSLVGCLVARPTSGSARSVVVIQMAGGLPVRWLFIVARLLARLFDGPIWWLGGLRLVVRWLAFFVYLVAGQLALGGSTCSEAQSALWCLFDDDSVALNPLARWLNLVSPVGGSILWPAQSICNGPVARARLFSDSIRWLLRV